VREIRNARRSSFVQRDGELAALERAIQLVAEHWKNELATSAGIGGPGDVEPSRVARPLTVHQHVVPIWILGAGAHVVRHDVEENPHVSLVELVGERAEIGFGTELWIDARWVDDIVSVFAASFRGENRRQV